MSARFRFLSILLFLALISISGCRSSSSSSSDRQGSDTAAVRHHPIRLGYSAWPGWLPWHVAEKQQLFEAHSVAVEMRWYDGYMESVKAFTSGQLDANCQTLNDTVSSLAGFPDQVIVLVNDHSTGNDKIIVREGIDSIADLAGKAVAAEQGTVDHYLLLLGLKQAGLTQADIDFRPLETGAAAAAFAAGQLDAVAVFAPFTTVALRRPGSKELFSSKDVPGAIPDHLVVNRKLVDSRPGDVQALVDTWFDVQEVIQKDRQRAYEIMAKRAGVTPDEYRTYDAGTQLLTIQENLAAFAPGHDMSSLPHAAEQIARFLVETGNLAEVPDMSRLFDDRFVKAHATRARANTKQ